MIHQALLTITILACTTGTLSAQVAEWSGSAGDHLWSSDSNWVSNEVPGFGDSVRIANADTVILNITADTITQLEILESVFIVDHVGMLTIGQSSGHGLVLENSTLSNYGVINVGDVLGNGVIVSHDSKLMNDSLWIIHECGTIGIQCFGEFINHATMKIEGSIHGIHLFLAGPFSGLTPDSASFFNSGYLDISEIEEDGIRMLDVNKVSNAGEIRIKSEGDGMLIFASNFVSAGDISCLSNKRGIHLGFGSRMTCLDSSKMTISSLDTISVIFNTGLEILDHSVLMSSGTIEIAKVGTGVFLDLFTRCHLLDGDLSIYESQEKSFFIHRADFYLDPNSKLLLDRALDSALEIWHGEGLNVQLEGEVIVH